MRMFCLQYLPCGDTGGCWLHSFLFHVSAHLNLMPSSSGDIIDLISLHRLLLRFFPPPHLAPHALFTSPNCDHSKCGKCSLSADTTASDEMNIANAAKKAAKSVLKTDGVSVDVASIMKGPPPRRSDDVWVQLVKFTSVKYMLFSIFECEWLEAMKGDCSKDNFTESVCNLSTWIICKIISFALMLLRGQLLLLRIINYWYRRLLDMLTTDEPNVDFAIALGLDTFIDLASVKWKRTEDVFKLVGHRIVVV